MTKKQAKGRNKYVSAGFGAIATFQTAVDEGFEKLVAKGEVARKGYRASITKVGADVRKNVTKQVDQVRNRVVSIFDAKAPVKIGNVVERLDNVRDIVTERASRFLNIPTPRDFDALNKKLDKVIKTVAA